MATKGVRTAKAELRDVSAVGRRKNRALPVEVTMSDSYVELSPEGYGRPVVLEYHDGKLCLRVFADANSEEPTHVIDLNGAITAAPAGDK
jgi:hypothetical protein